MRTVTSSRSARRGFTLIEVLIALALFAVMLVIIFVPMTMGFNAFNIGNSRSNVQQAANATISQMERELRSAVFVFPNDAVPGVSGRAPYTNPTFNNLPYLQIDQDYTALTNANVSDLPADHVLSGGSGVCNAGTAGYTPVANMARLDFLVPRRSGNSVRTPLTPDYYLVSYYARRLNPKLAYDAVENPIVLFRAQMPYRRDDNDDTFAAPDRATASNVEVTGQRYPNATACTSNASDLNRGAQWLVQDRDEQPLLEGLASDAPSTVAGSHTLITPRGLGLVAPNAQAATPDYTPSTSFTCQDANADGKIDRVAIRLVLGNFNVGGQTRNGQPLVQSQGLPQVVDLPNVK